ncbi:MAG: hypothetical protein LLG04_08805 [Parachlamydia sp.]|nr:hypothetical protein [Parachlamydia sp.]
MNGLSHIQAPKLQLGLPRPLYSSEITQKVGLICRIIGAALAAIAAIAYATVGVALIRSGMMLINGTGISTVATLQIGVGAFLISTVPKWIVIINKLYKSSLRQLQKNHNIKA